MLTFNRDEYGVNVTITCENQMKIGFGLYKNASETWEDGDFDYHKQWTEVLTNLLNGKSEGSTWICYYNCNGSYDVTFDYAKNTVTVQSNNFGAGMSIFLPIEKGKWMMIITQLLDLISH